MSSFVSGDQPFDVGNDPTSAPLVTPVDSGLTPGAFNLYRVVFSGDGCDGASPPTLFRQAGDVEALTVTVTGGSVFSAISATFAAADLFTRQAVTGIIGAAVFVDSDTSALTHAVQTLIDLSAVTDDQWLLLTCSLTIDAGGGDVQTVTECLTLYVQGITGAAADAGDFTPGIDDGTF